MNCLSSLYQFFYTLFLQVAMQPRVALTYNLYTFWNQIFGQGTYFPRENEGSLFFLLSICGGNPLAKRLSALSKSVGELSGSRWCHKSPLYDKSTPKYVQVPRSTSMIISQAFWLCAIPSHPFPIFPNFKVRASLKIFPIPRPTPNVINDISGRGWLSFTISLSSHTYSIIHSLTHFFLCGTHFLSCFLKSQGQGKFQNISEVHFKRSRTYCRWLIKNLWFPPSW